MIKSSNAYTRFVSGVLFPAHEAIKGHNTIRVFRDLNKTQWMSHEELRANQERRLAELLAHAIKHVNYYRRVLPADILGNKDGFSRDRLVELPLLTKDLIRSNLDELKSDGADGLVKSNTGGSTGEPLVFFLDKERKSFDIAAKWRATRWWNVDIGDRELVLWGSPVELGAQDRIRAIRDRLFRSKLLAAFEMSDQNLHRFLQTIRSMRPRMIFGYPSAIDHLASFANSSGQLMTDLGIKVVFTTSECLYEHQRDRISRTFGCDVANGYGGRDFGFVAHECPERGMHISADFLLLEILDEYGKSVPTGEAGEIVITNLSSKGFPLIRYRTGDVAALSPNKCTCGRGLPLLDGIKGRTTDFVVASDGTAIHALALIYVIRELPGVRSFKIVQENLTRTRIFVVPEKAFTSDIARKLVDGCRARLGSDVEIEIVTTDVIPPEKSGKHRHVVSKISVGGPHAPEEANAQI